MLRPPMATETDRQRDRKTERQTDRDRQRRREGEDGGKEEYMAGGVDVERRHGGEEED